MPGSHGAGTVETIERGRPGRPEGIARARLGGDPGGPPPGRRAERPDRRPAPRLASDRLAGRARRRGIASPASRRAGRPARRPGHLRDAAGRRRRSSLRADGGRLRFDPIDARLNEGVLHLEPELVRPEDGSFRLKFGPASTLENAVVNDEVSHRVLSYVAPVLDGATRVRGRVSVRRARRGIPAGRRAGGVRAGRGRRALRRRPIPARAARRVDHRPAPERREARPTGPMLVLRDPISVRIAERKVYQQGLVVPLGRIGSVGAGGLGRFRETP